MAIPDEEHAREQIDEASALSLIFPEEFRFLSPSEPANAATPGTGGAAPRREQENEEADGENDVGSTCTCTEERICGHPIAYSVRLNPPADVHASDPESESSVEICGGGRLWPSGDVLLRIEYPALYPDVPPLLCMELGPNRAGDDALHVRACLDACIGDVRRAAEAEAEVGVPSALTCVQCARDFFDSGGLRRCASDAADARDDGGVGGGASSSDGSGGFFAVDLLEALPRPILGLVLDWLGTDHSTGRLSAASKSLRIFVERRAKRSLRAIEPLRPAATPADGGGDMLVDGIMMPEWELEERRCADSLRTYGEQLYRTVNTTEFDFCVLDTDDTRRDTSEGGLVGWEWRIREGLGRGNDDSHPRGYERLGVSGCSWPSLDVSLTTGYTIYSFHYARAERAIPVGTSRVNWWLLVRVRINAPRDDGDLWVGIVTDQFDAPTDSTNFDVVPGGEFGLEGDGFAFVNVVSGGTPNGAPVEINFGLVVRPDDGTVEYGIPIDSIYDGRPIYNHGKVLSSLGQTTSPIHIAVVGARKKESAQFHASVNIRECSEREWNTRMLVPYNYM